MNEHTPIPWELERIGVVFQIAAFETEGEMAGNRSLQFEVHSHHPVEDSNFIIRAVNNYEQMLTALESVRGSDELCTDHWELVNTVIMAARASI